MLVRELQNTDERFLEKVIELWSLGNKIYTEAWNTEFHIFGVVSSDTEHLPLQNVRDKCSDRYLVIADAEIREKIAHYAKDLEESYRDILELHG